VSVNETSRFYLCAIFIPGYENTYMRFQMPTTTQKSNIRYICGRYVVTLNKTPTYIWDSIYMARLVVVSGDQKGTCHNESGMCAQNIDTILGPVVNLLLE
jgi:hypothetical protein